MSSHNDASAPRTRLVSTASSLFEKHGYHAIGIDRILAESAVAKATLYRHFSSKEALVAEVLREHARSVDNQIAELMKRERTAIDKLRAIFDWHAEWTRSESFSGCMFMHATAEFGQKAVTVMEVVREQKNGFVRLVESLLADIVHIDTDTKPLADFVVMVLDGAIMRAEELRDGHAIDSAWRQLKPLLQRR